MATPGRVVADGEVDGTLVLELVPGDLEEAAARSDLRHPLRQLRHQLKRPPNGTSRGESEGRGDRGVDHGLQSAHVLLVERLGNALPGLPMDKSRVALRSGGEKGGEEKSGTMDDPLARSLALKERSMKWMRRRLRGAKVCLMGLSEGRMYSISGSSNNRSTSSCSLHSLPFPLSLSLNLVS